MFQTAELTNYSEALNSADRRNVLAVSNQLIGEAIDSFDIHPGYSPIWYGMVWYGMVWYGMVWYGMVWYGMI